MASPTIQFKRGLVQNLPGLRAGEPGFATDRSDFYVGVNSTTEGNKFFGSSRYWIREDGTNSLKLNLVDKSGNNGVRLAAPDTLAGITTYTLPATPTDGYFLKTAADGTLSWATLTSSATFSNATLTGVTTITSVDLQGGSINGTSVGLTTASTGAFTTLDADSLDSTGNVNAGSVSIGSTQVVSSAFQLQNIASLDATTTATIEAAIANAPNTFTDLSVTGVSTFTGQVNAGAINATGIVTASSFVGDGANVTNLTYSNITGVSTAVRGEVSATSSDLGSLVYTAATGVFAYTGVTTSQIRDQFSAGTGVSYTSGEFSIGQDVATTSDVTFNTVSTGEVKAENGTAAITIDGGGNVGVSTNLTVSGNLFVNGTTTQVNTVSLTVEDTLVELGLVDGNAPASDLNKDLGLLLNYFSGTAKKAAVYWDDSVDRFAIASEVSEASSVLTANAYAALEVGSLYINNACTGGVQEVIGCANGQLTLSNIVVDGGSF
jgi:flavin-binding protein dodecin